MGDKVHGMINGFDTNCVQGNEGIDFMVDEAQLQKREQTKQKNRNQILLAAKQLFLEQGYDATTVRDIIRATELATGTFYNYFPDKESIFRAIIDGYTRGLAKEIERERHQATSLEEFLSRTYHTLFKRVGEDPNSYELYRRNESVIGGLYELPAMEAVQLSLRDDVSKAMGVGMIPNTNVDLLVAAFLGVSQAFCRALITSDELNPEQAADFAAKLFLGGMESLPIE